MPAKDLGTKWNCFKCSAKFYDLRKPDAKCPKCGALQKDSPALRPQPEGRRGRLAAVPKVIEPAEPEEPEAAAEEEEEIEDIEEAAEDEPAAGGEEDI